MPVLDASTSTMNWRIWVDENGGRRKQLLELDECTIGLESPGERAGHRGQLSEWRFNLAMVLDKSSIEVGVCVSKVKICEDGRLMQGFESGIYQWQRVSILNDDVIKSSLVNAGSK